jgi:hypothetical protein
MGWGSGSDLFDRLIKTAKKNVPDKEARARIYTDMIEAFEDADWDTQDECEGQDPVFDAVLTKRHGE